MRIIMQYDQSIFPPKLGMSIFGAPHRRQSNDVLEVYRDAIYRTAYDIGIRTAIDYPLDLNVLFVDPCSPDLDNCITALYRVLDAKALNGPSLLTDDGMIQSVHMAKFYPNGPLRSENRVP